MGYLMKSPVSVFSVSFISFAALILGVGCEAAYAAPKAVVAKAGGSSAPLPINAEILLTWRNLSLDKLDFEAAIQGSIPKDKRTDFLRDMRRITSILDDLQVRRTLADEAKHAGIDKDPVVVRQIVLATERILSQQQLERWEANLKIPDMTLAAEEQYKLKPDAYQVPEQVHASHVLIGLEKRSDAEAMARAEEVLAKAKAGADFSGLAKEYSDDPSSRNNNGDLGWFTHGRMVKPFADAAFALEKDGDLSGLVKSQFGYHVIKFHERKAAYQRFFDEVKGSLIDELRKKWVAEQKGAYLSEIRNNKSIRLNAPGIDSLQVK